MPNDLLYNDEKNVHVFSYHEVLKRRETIRLKVKRGKELSCEDYLKYPSFRNLQPSKKEKACITFVGMCRELPIALFKKRKLFEIGCVSCIEMLNSEDCG